MECILFLSYDIPRHPQGRVLHNHLELLVVTLIVNSSSFLGHGRCAIVHAEDWIMAQLLVLPI